MEMIQYTTAWKEKWDAFVRNSNNGTMFHLQKFFDYHAPGKFTFHHLMIVDQGNIVAVLPGELKEGFFESPIGASYGSIVTRDIRFSQAMDLISILLEYASNHNIREIRLTSAPLIYENCPNQNLDFAMLWQGFSYETHYISSAIRLNPDRDIIPRFQTTVRYNIRKSLRDKDIRLEINEKYDEFYPILQENLAKHNATPTHSFEDLLKLKSLMPENLKLFMVYYKNRPIGGSLMFYCNRNVSLCFYNMMRYEYARQKPIHRLMYEVVKDVIERGYRYVDIGVSQDTSAENPMTPNFSLIEFKETFDAKTIMRNTFYIKL
jgi:hypothetical protein